MTKEEIKQRREERRIQAEQFAAERRETVRIARTGLLRVMQDVDATPEQILEAARLLAEIGK